MDVSGDEAPVLLAGLFPHERELVRQLWLPPIALEVVRRWSMESVVSPRFRPNDSRSPDFTSSRVHGAFSQGDSGACLEVQAHDAGVLHEIAERALAEGVPSVVFEGDFFTGEAPFFAFTERAPDEATKTLWFDPLRALVDDAAIDALLLRRFGAARRLTLDELVRYRASTHSGAFVAFVEWMNDGRRLARPLWRLFSLTGVPDAPLTLVERISWTLALLLLAPIAIGFPFFFGSVTSAPLRLEALAMPGVVSLVLVSWLALIPFRWPSGERISRRVRLAWFVWLPLLVGPLVAFVRSR